MADGVEGALRDSDQPFTKGELRDLANEMRKRLGIYMTDDQLERIRYDISTGQIFDEYGLTEAIHAVVAKTSTGLNPFDTDSNKDRRESHALAEESLKDLGLPTTNAAGDPLSWAGEELASTKIISGPARWLMDAFTGGGSSNIDYINERDDTKRQREDFGKQLLADGTITYSQLSELREAGLMDLDRSFADVIDALSDMGVSDTLIEDTLQASTSATLRRAVKEIQTREEAEAFSQQEEYIVSDDDRLLRRKQFETLEADKPGKYVWNSDNAHIYEVGSGFLIDGSSGDIMQMDADGVFPVDVNDEDLTWDEASLMETPWSQHSIDEPSYYSLLDVVDNPQWYHQGGVGRFASGGDFLGGFAQDYGVVQTQAEMNEQLHERYGGKWTDPISGQPNQRSDQQLIAALRAGNFQEVRRPWYDPDDNWALYAGMSSEQIRQRQQELVDMGALKANEVVYGFWGEAEATVTHKMMNIANGNALQLEDISDADWSEYWEVYNKANTPKRPVYSAPAYRQMDPATAQLTVEETIRRQLGRDASPQELSDLGHQLTDMHRQSFQADVQAQRGEFNAQVRANDSGIANQAGAVEDVDWEAQFLTSFQQSHEAELARWGRTGQAAERQSLIGGAMNNFMNQLGSGIGGGN